MKLYLISQGVNNGYDTYDSAVVCAGSIEEARHTFPADGRILTDADWQLYHVRSSWCKGPEFVRVEYLGTAKEPLNSGVICASYNAG